MKSQIANAQKAADAAQAAADAAANVGDQAMQDAAAAAKEAAAAKLAAAEAQKTAIETAQKALDDATTELKGLIEAANTANKEEFKVINEKIATLEVNFNELLGEVKAIKNAVAANAEGLKELTTKVADVVTRLEAEEAATEEIKADIEALKTDVEALKAKDAELAESIKTTKEALEKADEKLSTRINVLDQKLADNITSVAVLEHEMQLQTATLNLFAEEVANLFANDAAKIEEVAKSVETAKAELETKIATDIEAAKAELNKVIDTKASKEEVNAAIKTVEDKVTAVEDALSAFKEDLKVKVSEYLNGVQEEYRGMVTSVSLVNSYANVPGENYTLKFSSVLEQNNVFEATHNDNTTKIEFKEGTQVQTPDEFIVRVSPVNVELKKEMISLVNSKGENLNDVIEVLDVQPYDELISRPFASRTSETGLWTVKVALKNYDKETFDKAAYTENKAGKKNGYVMYAVQVNNTQATDAERFVTSSYDLAMGWEKFKPMSKLEFEVDGTSVKDIANRFKSGLMSSLLDSKTQELGAKGTITYKEKEWKGIIPFVTPDEKNTRNALPNDPDLENRNQLPTLPVEQGKEFTVCIKDGDELASQIRGMYVTLDYQANAIESNPSEWTAWTDYEEESTGLNTVFEGAEAKITIDSKKAINDVIGLRVFAVNHDGTLVDPDGKAFYINVGQPVSTVEYDLTWTWTANGKIAISKAEIEAGTFDEELAGQRLMLVECDTVRFMDNVLDSFMDEPAFMKGDKVVEPNEADYITLPTHAIYTDKAYYYDDNKTYTATYAIKNTRDNVLKLIKLNLTKVLPTAAPEGYSRKTGQFVGDLYTCYLKSNKYSTDLEDNWNITAGIANVGGMNLSNVFTGIRDDENYVFTVANAVTNADEEDGYSDETINGIKTTANDIRYTLRVESGLIDSETEHATTLEYNYGPISSDITVSENPNYYVNVDNFSIKFACIMDATEWSWVSGFKNEITYGVEDFKVSFAKIMSTNKYTSDFTTTLDKLLHVKGIYSIKDAHLTSENGVEEYFTVGIEDAALTFAPVKKSETTNPTTPVKSNLTVTYVDVFGHENTITLGMTVKAK